MTATWVLHRDDDGAAEEVGRVEAGPSLEEAVHVWNRTTPPVRKLSLNWAWRDVDHDGSRYLVWIGGTVTLILERHEARPERIT